MFYLFGKIFLISFFFGKTFSGLVLMTLLFLESKEKFKTEMEIYKKKKLNV